MNFEFLITNAIYRPFKFEKSQNVGMSPVSAAILIYVFTVIDHAVPKCYCNSVVCELLADFDRNWLYRNT